MQPPAARTRRFPRRVIKTTVPGSALQPSPLFVDRYKAQHYPSNGEKIAILNITPFEAEVHFFFERDLKADTFLLDPPSMRLKPYEKQVGDGQVGQAPVEVPRSSSSCSFECSSVFLLAGTGLGSEPLGVPHFSWPRGRQPHLLH